MNISKIRIENFKTFKGSFKLELNKGINILIGDNEAGKSTIIEAIHLALSGLFGGRYLKYELSQYLFNNDVVANYIESLKPDNTPERPPHILIEIFIEGDDIAEFEGDSHSDKPNKACGFSLKIAFDEKYQSEYENLIKLGEVTTLPIEYYNVYWFSFVRDESITPRAIPIKSALIDSSSHKLLNGSDICISRIVKEFLDTNEVVEISQAHRKMKEFFMEQDAIHIINLEQIKNFKIQC